MKRMNERMSGAMPSSPSALALFRRRGRELEQANVWCMYGWPCKHIALSGLQQYLWSNIDSQSRRVSRSMDAIVICCGMIVVAAAGRRETRACFTSANTFSNSTISVLFSSGAIGTKEPLWHLGKQPPHACWHCHSAAQAKLTNM